MTKETIDAQQVLASVGGTTVHPPFVQRAGLWLAAGVGTVIALVTFGVVYFFISNYPNSPTPELLKTFSTDPKVALDYYKELSAIPVKNAQEMFQTIVTQALLPVFTAILGYIFAKGNNS